MKPNSKNSTLDHYSLPKLSFSFLFFFSLLFTLYSLKSLCVPSSLSSSYTTHITCHFPTPPVPNGSETEFRHIVFGIGAAARHWSHRKHFINLWWRPNSTRGFVFLDRPVKPSKSDDPTGYPELRVSANTNRFGYSHRKGSRAALRITRIVSEITQMGLRNVRWVVLGDDDTVFYPDNLVRVLRKYDHTRMYYIGSNSESHIQNIHFSYGMAYGGGGFAISYPLAKEIEKMQDRCIQRYQSLYGSDDRIHACLSELGVPLTKEPGFHQFDIYGNPFGILASHPVAPLVSLHHLDMLEPIFPAMGRLQALSHLRAPEKVDSASLMQQSICYDKARNWTISVSWGYTVQIIRGSIPAREMERPTRTFVDWYGKDDPVGFAFNTRPFSKHPCQKPYVYYLSNVVVNPRTNVSISEYDFHKMPHPWCWWNVANPQQILRVEVHKKPNPHRWDRHQAPRRDCCRILPTDKKGSVVIDVGECREGEVIEPPLLF